MVPTSRKRVPPGGSAARRSARPTRGHGTRLADVRRIIAEADPDAVEERKWRKPSDPDGVPVWSHDGMLCLANALKGRLRLTFPRGASLRDPRGLFNARLDSRTVRAIDIPEGESIPEDALKALIRDALALNASRARGLR